MTCALIRGITLTHPWAFAIAYLGKDVENRRWHPSRQGGQVGMYLAIHGGATPTGAKLDSVRDDLRWIGQRVQKLVKYLPADQYDRLMTYTNGTGDLSLSNTITPGIVAVARLAGVVQDSASPWAAAGQFHWQLADVITLPEPVVHKGAQGLWQIEPAALEQVRAGWKARTAA